MTWPAYLGLALAAIVTAGGVAVLIAVHAVDQMERERRELQGDPEGVEIDSGQLHDVVVPGDWE